MKTQYYTATSLDGFIATEDDSLDWLFPIGESDGGSAVMITINEGRLLAFPDDASGVFLEPQGEHTFTPVTSLTFEQDGRAMRFVRVD